MATQQKIHFITGKGGVGKSFFAAALAQALAYKHKTSSDSAPILLAEFNDHSFYRDYLQMETIGFTPRKLPNFDVAQWSGTDCLRE